MDTEFLNIPWQWGGRTPSVGLDCYGLCRHVRMCLDSPHTLQDFLWVYETHTETTLPYQLLLELLQTHCHEITALAHLSLVYLQAREFDGLGTVICSPAPFVVFMSTKGSRLESVQRMSDYIVQAFDPSPLLTHAQSV